MLKLQIVALCALSGLAAADLAGTAKCCSEFTAECFNGNSTANNYHSCKSCKAEPEVEICTDECEFDAAGPSCQSCCISYPDHEIPWSCPLAQEISCLADDYGVGNYSNYHEVNDFRCSASSSDAGFWFPLEASTVAECLAKCESTGIAGCCQFDETVSGESKTASGCSFMSSDASTVAELQNVQNGTEPFKRDNVIIVVKTKELRVVKEEPGSVFKRGVRCDAVPPQVKVTDKPATDAPTNTGSASGAQVSIGLLLASMVAVFIA